MKKVVFLGSKEIGYQSLAFMYEKMESLKFEIVAVGTNKKRDGGMLDFCSARGIRVLANLDELLGLDFDILLSVQYHEILKPHILKCAKEIALNLHLAPLPEYRGCNQFSFALFNEDKEFGVTLHKMDCGIDSGDIAFQMRFEIPQDYFVEDLVLLANDYGLKLLKDSLPRILSGDYTLTPQKSIPANRREYHARSEIESLKYVRLESCGGEGFN